METGLLVAALLVAANGFFVAVEFAATRARSTQIRELVDERRAGAKSAQHAVENLDAYLSACQLGITMASLGLGAIGEPAFHDLLEPVLGDSASVAGFGLASALAFLTITTLHVVIGELSPKSLALSRTEAVLLALAPPMRGFYLLTKPLVDLFNWMGNLLLRPFGVPPASEAGHAPHSEAELRELLRESSREGLIDKDEQELSEAALVFGDRRAREVMQPRSAIDYVSTADSPRDVARKVIETGRTRLPVCRPDGGVDSAVGVVNAKDLLPVAFGEGAGSDELEIHPLAHVSDSARIDIVLSEMRSRRVHLALVHDEHGTVVGLLTLEDIIEELVGEIEDEFDPDHEESMKELGGRLHVAGDASLRLLAQRLGFEPEDRHETTVGGYIADRLARVPDVGEVVEFHGRRLEILAVEDYRVTEVAVLPAEDGERERSDKREDRE